MALYTPNTATRVFQAGGIFQIVDGVDTYTVANLAPGTVSFTDNQRKRLEFNDRGPVQVPLELDDTGVDLDVEIRMAHFAGANELFELLRAPNTAANTAKTFSSVVIKFPDRRGSATGESLTFTTVWLREPMSYKAGNGDHDQITIKLRCAAGPTSATY